MSILQIFSAFGTVAFMALASVGTGFAALAGLGLSRTLAAATETPVAFVLGVGLLGWFAFFFALEGWLAPWQLVTLILPGIAGWMLPRSPTTIAAPTPVCGDKAILAGLALLTVLVIFDLAQVLSPPADADSLAYHFALPQQFLRAGVLEFVPRVADGAIPLLLQMTYLVALGIGGEMAMTLWVMCLVWAAAWLTYTIARTVLDRRWALAVVLLFLTTPAVVYGEGSGQLEAKFALFALVAGIGITEAVRSGDERFACLAGLAVGFFVGAKYTGLVFAAACSLVLLLQRRWLSCGAVFGCAILVAGSQWYAWNYFHTGDPLFPVLFRWLGARHGYWSPAAATALDAGWTQIEDPVPRSLGWMIAYPFVATVSPFETWDAGRTGLGPFGLIALPFALLGMWSHRARVTANPLVIPAALTFVFYAGWFFSGESQRVRHLLPLYPFLLICIAAAGSRGATAYRLRTPLLAAVGITLIIQTAGAALFGLNYIRHLFSGETRQAFLERNVANFAPVPWINAHLTAHDRILVSERQLIYYIDVPRYYASPFFQILVDLLPGDSTPERFLDELRQLGITHLLVTPSLAGLTRGEPRYNSDVVAKYTAQLAAVDCAEVIATMTTTAPRSRTLPLLEMATTTSDIVRLRDPKCRFDP